MIETYAKKNCDWSMLGNADYSCYCSQFEFYSGPLYTEDRPFPTVDLAAIVVLANTADPRSCPLLDT